MGELLSIPEWLAVTLWVISALSIAMLYGFWSIRRAHRRVEASRPNPTKQQFIAMMEEDCSPEVSDFLWEKAVFYVEPRLTPHPDDDLILDLKIDEDDIAMDWPRDWAEQRGFHESNFPNWPNDWPGTIRNYGRWLDMSPTEPSPRT
ncbi:hypothetical protein Q9K02_01820 [Qipengyuania sp. G39]|uniref:Uncharacterized protein n=1 Tax=Qipengyuania profundimaris TaxID=3067652 RepID=A0ABT9HLH6_9SPHN|nr:hypothetical protein [Qipengyuania sp. G39]MDP4573875.1 hypothetical protein [Qipengyuania sp. G39]